MQPRRWSLVPKIHEGAALQINRRRFRMSEELLSTDDRFFQTQNEHYQDG
jgi:hypothetical protein